MSKKISCDCKIKELKSKLDLSKFPFCQRDNRLCKNVEEQLLTLLYIDRNKKIDIAELFYIQRCIQNKVFFLSKEVEDMPVPSDAETQNIFLYKTNEFIFKDANSRFFGRFRNPDDPTMGIDSGSIRHMFEGTKPDLIIEQLNNLWINTFGKVELSKMSLTSFSTLAALWMLVFFAIHPFNDGNGRTARFFLSVIGFKAGFELIWWSHEVNVKGRKQRRYRNALRSCHRYRKRIEMEYNFGTQMYWEQMKKAIEPLALFFFERIVKDINTFEEKPPK